MSYTPPYPGGWKDFPDTSTPIDATSLDIMDAGIAAAQADADKIATTGYRFVETVYFTSSGTFTKATYPYLRAIRVRLVGGGGGGGGAAATGADTIAQATGGAGAAYAESFLTDIAGLSSSVTVTVGSGGSGGAAGTNSGSAGGSSSFGTLVSANGGGAGAGGFELVVTESQGQGGTGGATTATGDLVIPGTASSSVWYGRSRVGFTFAGQSVFSGQLHTNGTTTGTNGASGNGRGGGGSGAVNGFNQSARAGGTGSGGIVIVELYA
jgi:hypothetical protein